MNKVRLTLVATALLAAGVASAADNPPPGPRGPDMNRMAILLDLNDSQKADVQKILEEQRAKMRANYQQNQASGTRPTREEMRKQHQEMRAETITKLQAVLTPEQIKKFEALTDHPHHMRRWNDQQADQKPAE